MGSPTEILGMVGDREICDELSEALPEWFR